MIRPLICSLIFLVSGLAVAEPFGPDTTVITNLQPTENRFNGEVANGLVGQDLNANLADPNSVTLDEDKLNNNGREDKASASKATGIAGGVIATVTGGALIAAGLGRLALIDIPNQVAGSQLLALGALELSQGIANLASAGQNGNQENLLRAGADQNGNRLGFDDSRGQAAQQAAEEKVKREVLTPEVQQQLLKKGINPDFFFEQAAAGNLSTGEDVLRFFGGDTDVSDEDRAKAEELVSGDTGAVFAGQKKALEEAGLVDEDGALSVSVGFADEGPNTSSSGARLSEFSAGSLEGREITEAQAKAQGVRGQLPEGVPSVDVSQLVNKFLKRLKKHRKKLSSTEGAALGMRLQSLGIRAFDPAKNIFYIGRRCFRQFRRFRTKAMIRENASNRRLSGRRLAAKNALKSK